MDHLSSEKFEALWQKAQQPPTLRPVTIKPVQPDLSLSGFLERYMEMADRFLSEGKIAKADHDELVEAVARLKPVLKRINEKELVKQEVTRRARSRQGGK